MLQIQMAADTSLSAWRAETDAMPWYRDDDGVHPRVLVCTETTPEGVMHFVNSMYSETEPVEIELNPGIDASSSWPAVALEGVMQFTFNGKLCECDARRVSFMLAALRRYPGVCEQIFQRVNHDSDWAGTFDVKLLDLVYWLVRTYPRVLTFKHTQLSTYVSKWCGVIHAYETALPLVRYLVAQRADHDKVLNLAEHWGRVQYFRRHLARPTATLSRRRFNWIGHVLEAPGDTPVMTWLPLYELAQCTDRFHKCKMVLPGKTGYKHVAFGSQIMSDITRILAAMDEIVTL